MRVNSLIFPLFFSLSLEINASTEIRREIGESATDDGITRHIYCKFVIIGGGVSGAYVAMRLSEKYKSEVCLFEKEAIEGGRLFDVKTNPQYHNPTYIGVGGRRLIASQTDAINLAKEFNIVLQNPDQEEQFLFARGKYGFVTKREGYNNFTNLYPTMRYNKKSKYPVRLQLYHNLIHSMERTNILNHPNLVSYALSVIGDVGLTYLREMTKYKGDLEIPISAKSYIDWLEAEWNLDYDDDLYVEGGMSQFPKKMLIKAVNNGARIFRSEPVSSIEKISSNNLRLHSKNYLVKAENIVISIPPHEYKHINGNVIQSIVSQEEFKAIKGITVLTITQWFEYPWWKKIKRLSNNGTVWRAWSEDHCICSIEIPREDYLKNENVIRTVYSDRLDCNEHFLFLYKTNKTKLYEEVHQGLEQLLQNNGITTEISLPMAIKTVVKEWKGAWHWQREGSPFTNDDITNWSINPINAVSVSLVGDAYYMNRTSWIEGPILSAKNLLKLKYGISDTER